MAAGRALGVGAGVPDRVAPAAGAAVAQPNYHAQPRGMPAGMPPIMGMMGMPAGADVAGLLHLMPEGLAARVADLLGMPRPAVRPAAPRAPRHRQPPRRR